jgi:UrcA family protein
MWNYMRHAGPEPEEHQESARTPFMVRLFSVVSVAAVLAASAAAAQTARVPEVFVGVPSAGHAVRISTARVNFNDPASVRAFYVKVHAAASDVCEPLSAVSPSARSKCVAQTEADVADTLNRPVLTAAIQRGVANR